MWENPIITDTKNLVRSKRKKVAANSYKDLGYKQKLTVRIPQKNYFYVQVIAKRLNIKISDIYRYVLQSFIDMNFSKKEDGKYYKRLNIADHHQQVKRQSICFLAPPTRVHAVQAKCRRLGITVSTAFNLGLYKVIAEQR